MQTLSKIFGTLSGRIDYWPYFFSRTLKFAFCLSRGQIFFKKYLILKLFSDFEQEVFRHLANDSLGRAVENVIYVSKKVFGEMINFEKKMLFDFWFWMKDFPIFFKIFRIVLKNAFQFSIAFFWGKNYFNKNFFPYCFRTLIEITCKIWQILSYGFVKNAMYASSAVFWGNN